ncbi:MAG: O-antigen polymerase [Thermoleophilia bacterium]|nr:O-antigen polymerase [Thermoleophilia bacterium]MCZ4496963.1 O-antigen polymerase [Thermoleophilia bacterium]
MSSLRKTNVWLIGSTALLATVLGLLAAMNPAYGLGGLVVVFGLAAFVRSGAIAVCGFAATTYFEIIGAYLGESLSPIKIAGGALIVFAALSLVLTRRGHGASSTVGAPTTARNAGPGWREHPLLIALLVGFVAWALTSAAWATNVEQVRVLGTRLVTDALIFLAIPVFLHTTRQLRALGWTILCGGVASVLLGTALGANLGGRAIGTFADPNEYAAALVASTAIGLALAETTPSTLSCWAGRVMSATCLLGVIQSGSRGGLLAVFVAFFVLLVTARGRERVRMTGGLLVAAATGAAWLGLTPNGSAILARVTDPDSSGRSVLWRVAVRMYEQNPVTGVGLGNYPVLSRHYLQGDIEHLELFLRAPRVVHSTPLELLAELGTIGALLYYGFVVACLLAGTRALRLARRAGRTQLVGVIRGVFAAACAMFATTIFLSGQYQELTWVLLATCLAALAIARRADAIDAAAAALEAELVPEHLELDAPATEPGAALLAPADPPRPTIPA